MHKEHPIAIGCAVGCLSIIGIFLLAFALVSLFAHSVIDSLWAYLTGTAGYIGGPEARSAMEAGAANAPIWPTVVLAILALALIGGAIFLSLSGNVRHPPSVRSSISGRGIRRSARLPIRRRPYR